MRLRWSNIWKVLITVLGQWQRLLIIIDRNNTWFLMIINTTWLLLEVSGCEPGVFCHVWVPLPPESELSRLFSQPFIMQGDRQPLRAEQRQERQTRPSRNGVAKPVSSGWFRRSAVWRKEKLNNISNESNNGNYHQSPYQMLGATEDGSPYSHPHNYHPHLPTRQESQRAYMTWTSNSTRVSMGLVLFWPVPIPSVTLSQFPGPLPHDNLLGALRETPGAWSALVLYQGSGRQLHDALFSGGAPG